MSKKKVCLVIPSLQAGGMERVMSELANYFSTKNYLDVYIITLGNSKPFYTINPSIKLNKPNFNKRNWFIYTIRTLSYLRNKLRRIRPDAVLSFGETYNSFVLLSSMYLNIKVFVSDRSKPNKKWGIVHETTRRILYKKAQGIISQTKFSKEFLERETKHKNICVIPNPVNKKSFQEPQRRKVILYVGRLIATKQIDILLEIFSQTQNDEWVLWIVGNGPLKIQLEKKANDLGISHKVKFWGNQTEVERFYLEASVFAFTSVSEGFPNALLEALTYGLPSISFDCIAGPADLIHNDTNGFLIQEMDTNAYLTKLQVLMDNVELRNKMGKQASNIAKDYHISKIGEDYIKFLIT